MTAPDLTVNPLRASFDRGAATADLLRPQASRLAAGVFLVAAARAGVDGPSIAGGVVLILSSYGVAAVLNDLADIETDRANGRPRPLVTGQLSCRDAHVVLGACGAVVAGSQLLLSQPAGLAVTAAAVVLAAIYSTGPALQRHGVAGHALLAVAYLVLPLWLATSQAPTTPAGWLEPAAMLVPSGVAALLYKDFKDEAGDRRTGKRTPLVRWGAPRTHAAATVLLLASGLLGSVVTAPGWWLPVLGVAVVAQRRLAAGRGSLRGFRRGWYLACLLLVAGW